MYVTWSNKVHIDSHAFKTTFHIVLILIIWKPRMACLVVLLKSNTKARINLVIEGYIFGHEKPKYASPRRVAAMTLCTSHIKQRWSSKLVKLHLLDADTYSYGKFSTCHVSIFFLFSLCFTHFSVLLNVLKAIKTLKQVLQVRLESP